MSTALVIDSRPLSLNEAIEHRNALVEVYQQLMVVDLDYGIIPGTTKPTLLKPGAEKLCNRFGLTPTFEVVESIRDFTGKDSGGEPLFFYEIKCRLFYGDRLIAEGVGSCNSWESKYRFRDAKRVCPVCGKDAIIKGREEYGGGWLCFAKKSGCGAKFKAGDKTIEGQEIGRVLNPDIFDQVNTIRKMADKRALLAGTLIATGASEFFTQDVEDVFVIDVSVVDQSTGEILPPQRAPEARRVSNPPTPVVMTKDPNAYRNKLWSTLRACIEESKALGLKVQDALALQMNEEASNDEIIAMGKALREAITMRKAEPEENAELFPAGVPA